MRRLPLPLVTDRLLIRPFVPADLDALHAVYGDPQVMRWAGGVHDRAGTERALRAHIARHAEDGRAFWAVGGRDGEGRVGDCGLGLLGGEVEIGWTLRRDRWGRGLAAEAARAVLAEALGPLGLDRVVATIHRDNSASVRVAEELGMTPDGTLERDGQPQLRFVVRRG